MQRGRKMQQQPAAVATATAQGTERTDRTAAPMQALGAGLAAPESLVTEAAEAHQPLPNTHAHPTAGPAADRVVQGGAAGASHTTPVAPTAQVPAAAAPPPAPPLAAAVQPPTASKSSSSSSASLLPSGLQLNIQLQQLVATAKYIKSTTLIGQAIVELQQLVGQGGFADVYLAKLCSFELTPAATALARPLRGKALRSSLSLPSWCASPTCR